jgi:hypothetical protein
MQKISKAMAPYSRLLIHEFSKNTNYSSRKEYLPSGAHIRLAGGFLVKATWETA